MSVHTTPYTLFSCPSSISLDRRVFSHKIRPRTSLSVLNRLSSPYTSFRSSFVSLFVRYTRPAIRINEPTSPLIALFSNFSNPHPSCSTNFRSFRSDTLNLSYTILSLLGVIQKLVSPLVYFQLNLVPRSTPSRFDYSSIPSLLP